MEVRKLPQVTVQWTAQDFPIRLVLAGLVDFATDEKSGVIVSYRNARLANRECLALLPFADLIAS